MSKLGHYLQKTILVSMPQLTGNDHAHPYRLVDIEPFGLWLESDNFAGNFARSRKSAVPPGSRTAFVPFTQIAYVLGESSIVASVASQAVSTKPPTEERDRLDQSGAAKKGTPVRRSRESESS
jgi:hypothetical protein